MRINPVESGLATDDLRGVLSAKRLPNALVVPKVNSPEEMEWLFKTVEDLQEELGIPHTARMRLITQVESALGLINLRDILSVDRCRETESIMLKHDCIILGGDDFAADLGATRTRSANELLYARQACVVHAKAFGLQVIDIVNINFKDLDFLRQEAEEGMQMGFTGKQIIHPAQVDIVQEAFFPSAARIAWATEIVAAFNAHDSAGTGAFSLNDQMIDMPTVKRAQSVLQMANRNDTISLNV